MAFNEWIEESKEIEDKSILIIKNGIEYKIALTNPKKPKYKKDKFSGRKKYFLSGILLHNKAIANQKEIDKIIAEEPSEEQRYIAVSELAILAFYNTSFTPKQYRHLCNFLDTNKIGLNECFYFRRFGKLMTSNFRFYLDSERELPKKQSKLKK